MAEIYCKKIIKIILPAIRVSVARRLKNEQGFTQERIASELGVAQTAVSKYLNGRYSAKVKKLAAHITKNSLEGGIIKSIVAGKPKSNTDELIDRLCAEKELIRMVK